ncbi:MAG: ATP-binding protein [Nakamurella sp.]
MSVLGYLAVGLAGVVLGWLACALRSSRRAPRQPVRVVAEPALESTVLRLSTTGYLVLNQSGRPLLSNPAASELGVLRGGIVDQQIVAAAARAAVSGEPVDVELRPVSPTALLTSPRSTPTAVLAVVRAIGDDLILVSATDESAAQRMEAARRDFVANVSHELKTPVAAMGLLAEVTVEAADDPAEVRRFAGKLQAEAVRLGALVNELIALSRLQGADPLPDLAVVEVDGVIDETISRVSTAAENAGITLISDARSGLLVRGDRSLLVTALTNLVDNAINYSLAGTQVSVSRSMRDGQVQIAVTDRGVGIAPEFTERVFERFFRIDPARSRSTGGTGLGLAIVKHVAANHGGTATVWSRPGTGSTFTLRLPGLESAGLGENASAGLPGGTVAADSSNASTTTPGAPTAVPVHRGVQ